jgi:hypothetical protein
MEKADDAIFVHLDPLTILFFGTSEAKAVKVVVHFRTCKSIVGYNWKTKAATLDIYPKYYSSPFSATISSTKKGNIERGVYGRILT